jgi:hypothetical protein
LLLVAAFIVVPALMGVGYYTIHPAHSDFMLYYRDARTGWVFGWSHLYDVSDWDAITRQLGIHSTDPNSGSLSLPLLSWLVAPYALLPMPLAFAAWFVTLACAAGVAWWVAAPSIPVGKWVHLAVAVTFLPLVFGLTLGSAVVLAFAAVATSWWLSRRGHPVFSGLVLSLTLIRPQVALLIPICLLIAGASRVFLGYAAGAAMVAIVTLLTIPLASLSGYLNTMTGVAQHPASWQVPSDLTVISVRPLALAVALAIAIAAVALWVSALGRRSEHRETIAIVAGILASLLITPYIHLQDLTMLLLAVWLCLHWLSGRWWPAVLIPVAAVANFEMSIHTLLPALLEATWLALLLIGMRRIGAVAAVHRRA